MNAGGYKITNLADGSDPNDVVNKKQLDTKFSIPTIFSIPEDGETKIRTVIESKLVSFNGISLLPRLMLVQESDFMFNVKRYTLWEY